MSFVGNLFGAGDSQYGSGGMNYKAGRANVEMPSNADQAAQSYGQTQSAIQAQQNFIAALQAQNGTQNLSDVYRQYQNVANGTGPNPAMAAYNQATQQNIQNQAAMMGSQRGAGANVGLIGRQIAMQGANTQQQAAQQAATLQAQQQLGALNQMGGIANAQVGYLGQAVNNYNQASQNEQQNLLNSIAEQNNSKVGMQSNMNSANSNIAQSVAQGQQKLFTGIGGNAGSGMLQMSRGGVVPHYDEGGPVSGFANYMNPNSSNQSAKSRNVSYEIPPVKMVGDEKSSDSNSQSQNQTAGLLQKFMGGSNGAASDAGSSVSGEAASGSADLLPGAVEAFAAKGGMIPHYDGGGVVGTVAKMAPLLLALLSKGGKVPGKAKIKGDSYSNDVVDAKLSPGEVVIPRHVMQSNDPVGNSAKFIAAILKKNGGMMR